MKKLTVCVVTALAALVSACSSNSASSEPAATVTVHSTTTATATSTVTVTETAAAESAAPTDSKPAQTDTGHLGLVWSSAVDESRINQPADTRPVDSDEHGIETRIDMIVYVDKSVTGDLGRACTEAIRLSDDPAQQHCIWVQWGFDVPADYGADYATLSPGAMVTPDGKQILQGMAVQGFPAAQDVRAHATYAGGTPGSTLRWSFGSNSEGFTDVVYEIPPLEDFQPITFD